MRMRMRRKGKVWFRFEKSTSDWIGSLAEGGDDICLRIPVTLARLVGRYPGGLGFLSVLI